MPFMTDESLKSNPRIISNQAHSFPPSIRRVQPRSDHFLRETMTVPIQVFEIEPYYMLIEELFSSKFSRVPSIKNQLAAKCYYMLIEELFASKFSRVPSIKNQLTSKCCWFGGFKLLDMHSST